jgi:hypothetical protein
MEQRQWMFTSDQCINGLAHGQGLAASLDGEQLVVDGTFVLGRMVDGEVKRLTEGGG